MKNYLDTLRKEWNAPLNLMRKQMNDEVENAAMKTESKPDFEDRCERCPHPDKCDSDCEIANSDEDEEE